MKIVLFEYVTGGGAGGEGLSALAREGELMLHALGRGLAAIEDVRLVTVRDARLPPPAYETALVRVEAGDDGMDAVRTALKDADAFWPVAPETGGLLARLCRLVEDGSCLLLNSPASVVEEAGGKYRACRRLRQNGVACVETKRLNGLRFPHHHDLVIKPDDGTGCESVHLLRAGESPPHNSFPGDYLYQPYLPGVAASLSVIYSPVCAPYIVGANRQEVALQQRRFRLRACHVNALAGEALDFEGLAAGVQRSFPGIAGHVGIDLIVTGDHVLRVLEINPRVTTSFAGLAASTGLNPCAEVIHAVRGEARERVPRRCFTTVEVRVDDIA